MTRQAQVFAGFRGNLNGGEDGARACRVGGDAGASQNWGEIIRVSGKQGLSGTAWEWSKDKRKEKSRSISLAPYLASFSVSVVGPVVGTASWWSVALGWSLPK